MNYVGSADEPGRLSGAELRDAVLAYASSPLYRDNDEWENDDNPYRRQLRPQVLQYLDFDKPLRYDQMLHYESLAAQRMLTCIYDVDLLFLPESELTPGKYEDFRSFYSPDHRARGEAIRPALEQFTFAFLEDEVSISGAWNAESLEVFLRELENRDRDAMLPAEKAIRESSDPRRAAKMWLIQFAPDFRSGASPMPRNLLGNIGQTQSELFKIIVERYGYGARATNHRFTFERILNSVGLQEDPHRYWQYYLPGSLLLNNYLHYLGKNHELVFRHLGALDYIESTLVDFCARAAALLADVFDGELDVGYFVEQINDTQRGRIVLEKLILPIVQRCGPAVITEILRGYEEFQVIARLADEDFVTQISWMDAGPTNKQLHLPVYQSVVEGKVAAPITRIVELYGELSNTHSHQGDALCHVVSGSMKFVSGFQSYQILEAGEGIVIWRDRLHGAIIESDECEYEIHSVGDYRKCL